MRVAVGRLVAGLIMALALGGAAHAQQAKDDAAFAALIERDASDLRAAWDARDASRVFPSDAAARQDLQLRMNQTTAILELKEKPTEVRITGDRAVVVSDQLLRRMVKQRDGALRERIQTATHRRNLVRSAAGEWQSDGAPELLGQTGRWADGKP